MKSWIAALTGIIIVVFSAASLARDDRNRYSIEEAMSTNSAQEKLNQGYSFQFGPDTQGKILSDHGEVMVNKKTSAFAKSDRDACNWVFLSAMISFQELIARDGGNAAVNIRSYYKKGDFSSSTEFECGNGAIMAGVTFIGDIVTLEK